MIRRLLSAQSRSVSPDRQLLERFIAHKDEAAFAALVERHGAMVLDVARNVLHHLQDAEDVFQATFLVLARKAASVRKQDSAGSWLHGVAYRLALKARTAAAARRRHEMHTPAPVPRGSPDDLTWRELSAILHEELERLPDRYRAPLVLCYLEEMTQDQAAEHLGLAKGTLRGRLERARLLLRRRLGRRGLAPAVVLLADTCRPVGAAPPGALVSATARAAAAFAAGRAAGVSASVARMTEGVLKTMFATQLRSIGLLLLAIGLVVAGAGALASRGASGGSPATGKPTAPEKSEPEKPKGDSRKGPPWGKAVGGWRMRVTLTSGTEYRRKTPLPLSLELQNVSGGPLPLGELGPSADPVVTDNAGKGLRARPLIDVSPWEGRRDQLPAGASLKWTVDFGQLRFAGRPLKAGGVVQVRFQLPLRAKAARGGPRAERPRVLSSNAISVNLRDDHPSVLAGAGDLPAKWAGSMVLVYREHRGLSGYRALRIDGAGRVGLVTVGRGKGGVSPSGTVRTEVVLNREHLDRLARFLRDQKVWELAEPDKLAAPDEGEIRLAVVSGRGTLVGSFPDSSVRGQPKLLELKAAMEHLMAVVIKEAAVKAARARETPTFPTPARAADIKVDFEEVSISIRPNLIQPQMPESIRVRGDGVCEYRIEGRPARGGEPRWDPAYLEHRFDLKRLRLLEGLLKKTDWLTAKGYQGRATHTDATKYTLTVKRRRQTRTIAIDGEKGEPYKSLLSFFRGVAHQENLVYRLERLPGKESIEACRLIDLYVQAEQGGPYGKPPFAFDLRRYLPTFRRYARDPFDRPAAEVVPAVRLLGHLRSEADREHIAALAHDRDRNVRVAVAEALGRLGGKKSLPVLRRMIRSTTEAAWQLIRLGPLAVPTIVEVIESGSDRFNARQPEALDFQRLIRAYVDHWKEVPKPIDPRVLAAVRKSMASPKVKGYGIEYHKKLLDLASRSTTPK
jgi:RNA polymerase sigma factor (sigma-70 family)